MPSDLRDVDDNNPFAPPTAGIGERAADVPEADPEAEAIRRAHIGRETAVRAIGYLNYGLAALFGFLGLLYVVFAVPRRIAMLQTEGPGLIGSWASFLAPIVVSTVGLGFFGGVGWGLRRLRNWSRWTMIVFGLFGLALFLYGGAVDVTNGQYQEAGVIVGISTPILGLILYSLASPRGRRVFSREYKAIIARTPHVKNRTTTTTKVVAVILSLAIAAGLAYLLSRV